MPTNYNVQYNIPRVQIQLPGRQNRLTDGNFSVTPSMTEPVKFIFGNQDGMPIGLLPFKLSFVVWENSLVDNDTVGMGQSNIIINKRILVDDPYSGYAEMILNEADTILLGNHASGQHLKWSIFMINDAGEVFATQVSHFGGRVGTLSVDIVSGIPLAELIRAPLA